jgi:hypothetical protein
MIGTSSLCLDRNFKRNAYDVAVRQPQLDAAFLFAHDHCNAGILRRE